jgi:PAS domain S-box-containing protein
MIPASLPSNEADRVRALRELAVLDSAAEERFDRLTRLAQDMFETPIALVSLVDSDRQWFKSRQGLEAQETSRDIAFCSHAILQEDVFVVPDTLDDARFADNPLVTGNPDIRFYAGAPLKTSDGLAVGTLCVIDNQPRTWTDLQARALRGIADLVELEINQARVQNQQRALLALTAVTALTADDRTDLLRSALALGCEFLGMPVGAISQVQGEEYRILVQTPAEEPAGSIEVRTLGDTYCSATLNVDEVLAIPDAAVSDFTDHPGRLQLGLESYIGIRILGETGPTGTLTFSSPDRRASGAFSEADRDFVRLLGYWAASVLRRWQLDDELAQQQRISRFITRAQSDFILHDARSTALEGLLEDILTLTDCAYGLIGDVCERADGTPVLVTRALTNIAWNEATREIYSATGGRGIEFDNPHTLLGAVVASGDPVIANNPYGDSRSGGLPSDHPPMSSYLGLPIHRGGKLVGMLGLANKPGGFGQGDVDYLQPLLAAIGQLLEASAIRRQYDEDQKSIARLSMVASQMPSGVLITDLDGRIEWVNDGFTRMLGYAREEILGQRPRDVLHGTGTDGGTEMAIRAAMERNEPFSAELLAYGKDGGEVWVALESTPLLGGDEHPAGFMVITTDISDRRRVERMKGEFVSTVSHELRTPLTAITGALGLVAGGVAGQIPEQVAGMVGIALQNSERLTALIDDLLDMEKLIEGGIPMETQAQDLMAVVDRAIADNQSYAEKFGVRLAGVTRADGVFVDVDSLRLLQVLANLLSNACKFAPAGTDVEVGVHASPTRVRISVTDYGPGIPVAFRDTIFEKFSQADGSDSRARGGTGLGLAISKALVERMGGTISFDSVEGEGATFHVDLPTCGSCDGEHA